MKKLFILLAVMVIVMSCGPAPVYHVTIKTTEGIILYDDKKPMLKVSIRSIGKDKIWVGVYSPRDYNNNLYAYEVIGSNLMVIREESTK